MIFSKSYCPYCDKVKQLFKSLGVFEKAHFVELDNVSNGNELQDAMAKEAGARSVPQVFIDGEKIGGCDDTHALNSKGLLVPKLKKAGLL